MHPVWGSRPGGILLYAALLTHFVLALAALYRRRTLRMPPWEALQLLFGLLFVPLLATHVIATRFAQELLGVEHEYARLVIFIWGSTTETTKQLALIVTAWLHLVLGIHFWLRLKSGYRRVWGIVLPLYTIVPVLAIIGFYRSGLETELLTRAAVRASMNRLGVPLPEYAQFVGQTTSTLLWFAAGLVVLVLAARTVRSVNQSRRNLFIVEHPTQGEIRGTRGQTILEALRAARIPHASVCGGRGRCTTCRIRVGTGLDALPAPSTLEANALARIEADPSVRLACQTRPSMRVSITPLLPPTAAARQAGSAGGVGGTERVISVLFIDLRGSTRLGQTRLPYDVLFILNQFFSEMAQSLVRTKGHYAQFNGDGLMAMYGHGDDESVEEGARAAIAGGIDMLQRIGALNERLHDELDEPLRIGVGIHTGEAIVGTMGPPSSPNFSAIGDNINVATRLESLTKTLECPMVISAATARHSGLNFDPVRRTEVEVRGREGKIAVYAVDEPSRLAPGLA